MNNTTITTQRQNHVELSRLIAIEGMVLLKNENNTLPLKDKNIALFGSGARFTHKGGTGSGDVYTFKNVTIEDGLVNYGYNNTAEFYLNECSEISKIREIERRKIIRNEAKKVGLTDWNGSMFIATKYPFGQNIDRLITIDDVNKCNCDTGMYVISRQAGEGGDRKNEKGDYYLTDVEKENIQFIVDHFKNSIVILNTAAPIDIKDVYDSNASAIILYGQAGQEGGNALASLISGESNFSGKLTVSWPQKLEDLEISKDYSYLDGNDQVENYYDDIYVGYRYYDSFGVKSLFPFGFGLSYTTFENNASYKIEGNDLVIDVCVKNTGLAKGKETIQCYSSAIGLDIDKEVKSLISFKKTRLIDINDSCNITLKIDLLDLATYIENEHKYILKKGTYAISFGNSSDNTKNIVNIKVNDDFNLKSYHTLVEEKPDIKYLVPTVKSVLDETIKTIEFVPSEVSYEKHIIEVDTSKTDNIKASDLCSMVVGKMPLAIKGSAGVVGATSSTFPKYGFNPIHMADGPAGLRLSKEYYHTIFGKNKGTMMIPEDLQIAKGCYAVANKIVTFSFSEKRKQYTTAFPVSIMQAQTFNENLLYEMGKAVKEEMIEFGIHIWLAPGMNIIRHPLGGRSFEYYSEDPLISGKMAAAISKGVASDNSKKTVCVKHFCCNNQETNRMKTSSMVSERALMEIYLKGFKIAIEEGQVMALMTSYNKVNGKYVNSNRNFLDGFLREDCGFKGFIMTDWSSVAKGQAIGHEVISAGNDIIMTGGKSISNEILKSIGNGLELEQLKKCASRLIAHSMFMK